MRERQFYYWFMWAAVVLLVAATLHMFLMHMFKTLQLLGVHATGEPLAWEEVVKRAKDASYLTVLFFLLTAALYHGTYGLRAVLIEAVKSQAAKRAITWTLVVVGLAAYAWGLYFLFAGLGLGG